MRELINSNTFTGPSFSIKNRLLRMLWSCVYVSMIRPSPVPLHKWRVMWLRVFGAKLGRGVHIYPGAKIWAPWNLECGDEVGVGNGVILYNQGMIKLGRRVVVSQGAHLCTGSHDYTKPGFRLYTKPIIVGADAWIAAEAFIHPGVIIGEGTVIGARSVVTKLMPDWSVCAGHPCIVIKARVLE